KLSDETLILADIAAKSIKQVETLLSKILQDHVPAVKVDPENIPKIAKDLVSGVWTHDHPITVEDAHKLGLPVKTGLPEEIYQLMYLYLHQSSASSSVQFIPIPYNPPVKVPPMAPASPGPATKP